MLLQRVQHHDPWIFTGSKIDAFRNHLYNGYIYPEIFIKAYLINNSVCLGKEAGAAGAAKVEVEAKVGRAGKEAKAEMHKGSSAGEKKA